MQLIKSKLMEHTDEYFFEVTVCNVPSLYFYSEVVPETVPKGFFIYSLCDDSEGKRKKAQVEPWIYRWPNRTSHCATLIATAPVIKQRHRIRKQIRVSDFENFKLTTEEKFFKKWGKENV